MIGQLLVQVLARELGVLLKKQQLVTTDDNSYKKRKHICIIKQLHSANRL